ncbi:MAG: helix-hairpin-helix domain-containing protein, partial [Acutalibacteraceae bacterium]
IDGEIADKFLIEKYLSDKSGSKVNFILPKKGEQFNLVQMCAKNAEESLLRSKSNKNETEDTLEELRNVLKLNSIPKRIEAYDISNLMGSDNVGGMIVYKNGKPLKKAYRKFKIKNIIGQDDYGSIREVVSRRILEYLNSSEKNSKKIEADDSFFDLPDLILIDGGITHTRAASEILAEFGINIPVFGMVKDSKHRTRALTTDGREIEIKKYNRLFNFITRIQDEVHRFTINYHKNLRNKKIISSELLKIPEVGPARAKILLNEYGSIDNIAEATVEKLESIGNISRNIAENIYKFFHK